MGQVTLESRGRARIVKSGAKGGFAVVWKQLIPVQGLYFSLYNEVLKLSVGVADPIVPTLNLPLLENSHFVSSSDKIVAYIVSLDPWWFVGVEIKEYSSDETSRGDRASVYTCIMLSIST